MSYTKGPWAVVAKPSGIILKIGPLRADEYAGASWLDVTKEDAALMAAAPELLEALEAAVSHIERNTCMHEETYRGGAIWEICRQCGAKWADDDGGKPEFKWPDCVEKARALIAKHRGGA